MESSQYATGIWYTGGQPLGWLDIDRIWAHVEQLTMALTDLSRSQQIGSFDGGVRCRCGCVVYPRPVDRAQASQENAYAVERAMKPLVHSGTEVTRCGSQPNIAGCAVVPTHAPGVSVPPSQYGWTLQVAQNRFNAFSDVADETDEERGANSVSDNLPSVLEHNHATSKGSSLRRRKRGGEKVQQKSGRSEEDIDRILHELAVQDSTRSDAAAAPGMAPKSVHSNSENVDPDANGFGSSYGGGSGDIYQAEAGAFGGCPQPPLQSNHETASGSNLVKSIHLGAAAGGDHCPGQSPSTHGNAENHRDKQLGLHADVDGKGCSSISHCGGGGNTAIDTDAIVDDVVENFNGILYPTKRPTEVEAELMCQYESEQVDAAMLQIKSKAEQIMGRSWC